MGVFEADSFLESSLHFEYQEIDVDELLNRIQQRYIDYREHSYASHPLCVVSIEEYRALTYGFHNWTDIHKIRCPINRFEIRNGLKRDPYMGMSVFGMQLIGSDNIGELSPLIL